MRLHKLFEKTDKKLELPDLEVGDEVKVGKFKNRKAEITGFTKDEHNQPVMKTTKGDQKVFKNRHSKLEESSNTIYYHGTNREFGKFEVGADKANRATNITGVYFTPHQWEAEEYGKRVIQARLNYTKLFNVQKWNDINGAMKRKALELLAKHTTYREEWLKKAIIPDLVEKGYFAGGLRDVSGDIKREILLAGGYDAIKDGDHIAMLTTDGIEVVENEQVTEVVRLNNTFVLNLDDFASFADFSKDTGADIGGYSVWTDGSNIYLADDNGSCVGALVTDNFSGMKQTVVELAPELRGKNIAIELYLFAIQKLGWTIVSDGEQSRGAEGIWDKLVQNGVNVYIWDADTEETIGKYNPSRKDEVYGDDDDEFYHIRLVATKA